MLVEVQHWFLRHRHLSENLIWVWLATAAVLAGLVFLIDPAAIAPQTPVARLLHPYDYLWNVGFLAGGLAKLVGFFSGRPHLEALGMMLLVGALMISFAATIMVVGFVPSTLSYPVLALAGVARVAILVSFARTVGRARALATNSEDLSQRVEQLSTDDSTRDDSRL